MKRDYHLTHSDIHLLNEVRGAAEIGLHDDAVLAWAQLSEQAQQTRDGLYSRCCMLYHAGRFEECIATAEASPWQGYAGAWLWRIEALRKSKQHVASLAVALLALDLFYDNPCVLLAAAKALKDTGDKRRSRALVKEAAKLDRKLTKSSPGWWNAPP